jgi:hypothetical protein
MDTTVSLPVRIRQQRIVDVHSVGVGLGWLIIVPLCLTIVGILLAAPLMMILHRMSISSANCRILREANQAFPAFIGTKPEYLDVTVCGYGSNLKQLSASGMAYAGGHLYVLEEGVAAELPWDLIRSWTWKIEGASRTELYGNHDIGTQMHVGSTNQNNAALAFRQSGFKIVTADIDKPEWRFQTDNAAVLKKWMEIMTQMHEGRLPRR